MHVRAGGVHGFINLVFFSSIMSSFVPNNYPPLWGHRYWFLLHASAYSFRGHTFTDAETEHLSKFLFGLVRCLPCATCRVHAEQHMHEHSPAFTTGEDYWAYTVAFHNAVNVRTAVPTLTLDEARDHLLARLYSHGVRHERLQTLDSCLRVFWVPVLHACFVHLAEHTLPNTEDFLYACCFAFPFSRSSVGGELAFSRMRAVAIDGSTHESMLRTVCTLHNALCGGTDTSVLPMLESEMVHTMHRMLRHAPAEFVHHAYARSRMDKGTLARLQAEVEQYKRDVSAWKRCCAGLSCTLVALALTVVLVRVLIRRRRPRSAAVAPDC